MKSTGGKEWRQKRQERKDRRGGRTSGKKASG